MARVTEAEVQEIMEEYPDDLSPFIAVATLLVDEDLEPLGLLSDEREKEIERWLSAHFAAVRTPLSKAEGVSKISQTLQRGSPGKGLASTQYGQNAISMDTTGTLKQLADGVKVSLVFESIHEPWQDES